MNADNGRIRRLLGFDLIEAERAAQHQLSAQAAQHPKRTLSSQANIGQALRNGVPLGLFESNNGKEE